MAKQDDTECAECGQAMTQSVMQAQPRVYCSQACKYKAYDRESKNSTGYRYGYKPVDRANETQWCAYCEGPFHHRTKRKYCSTTCRGRAADRRKHPESLVGSEANCQHCGKRYTRRASNQIACSTKCSKRLWRISEKGKVSNAKRTAFMRVKKRIDPSAEQIDVWSVFERDGWRCQICGRATPKRHRGTRRRNAPELDHRIPLTRGGAHTYSNVQTACWECNHTKGNRNEVGQFPLFSRG